MSTEPAAQPAATYHGRDFAYWQTRILLGTLIGYAIFYIVRKNIGVAAPVMYKDLGITKTDFGLFLTLNGLMYGVSKFFNGIIGDRVNARWFMAIGLLFCAVVNILFGFSSSLILLGVLWTANGWFQGMGFPPCARLMTHWFSPRVFATKMGIWNTSHSLGAAIAAVLSGYLAAKYGWRLSFVVPGIIALIGAAGLAIFLRDTPESLGFPPVEGTADHQHDTEPLSSALRRLVFSNPFIWLLSFANFFVYVVRYGVFDWGATFLKEARGIDLENASWIVAAYEVAGLVGILTGGWITDRVFGGRGARACFFYMVGCTVALVLFWKLPNQTWISSTIFLCVAGFFIYGPQSLIGTAAANLGTKRAAAAAVGLTGLFGYASTLVSGVGVGALAQHHGWDAGFALFAACSMVGVLLLAACWPAKAHGYTPIMDDE